MKTFKRILILSMVGMMSIPALNVSADVIESQEVNQLKEERLVVRKYVERTYSYVYYSDIPQYRVYSYFDHDYNTTLKGTLELVDVEHYGTYYEALYAGWCSGSI